MSDPDPITVSVVQHRLAGIVDEMGEAMLRTSFSQILNSSRDFSTAITDAEGELVAQAEYIPVHVGAMPSSALATMEAFGDDVHPGDVFLLNDPYHGGSHLPDLTACLPVFAGGRLLFWALNRAHHSDIGGATYGAYNASATEIWQEGLRVPPLRLYDRGALREDVMRMLRVNVRHPRDFEGDLAARFAEKVTLVAATFAPVDGIGRVSRAVADYLEGLGLDKDVVATTDPLVEQVRWSNEFAVARRAAEAGDRVSVTGAFAGIAETGTLVFVSDRTTPTTLGFLPETHIAVLARDRLVAHLEDVWARLRNERTFPPRTVNFITGPSRTGDIELQLELGAHGPRRLHVLLVDP